MTVSTTNNKKVYSGLTGQDTFAYDFRVDAKADMKVYLDAVEYDPGNWSITGLGNDAGGNVVFNIALTANTVVTLLREVTETQATDYQPLDAFPAETHEAALDKLTFIAQQLSERISRNITFPLDSISPNTDLPSLVADALLGIASDGSTLQFYPVIDVSGVVANGSINTAQLANDAVTTAKLANQISVMQRGADVNNTNVDASNILTFPSDGNAFHFTGDQQVEQFATIGIGTVVLVVFESTRRLVHNAVNLVLPGAQDIITATGDIGMFYEYAAGDWRCISYSKADGAQIGTVGEVIMWDTDTPPTGFLEEDGSAINMTSYEALYDILGNIYGLGSGTSFTAATDDTLTSAAHPLSNGDVVEVSNSGGGLPAGLAASTKYFVIDTTTNTFKVSLTKGGSAVDVTSTGTGTHSFHREFKLCDMRGEFPRGWDNTAGNDPDAASRTDRGDSTTGDNIGTKQGHAFETHLHSGGIVSGSGAGGNGGSWVSGFSNTGAPVTGTTSSETRPRNTNKMFCIRY